MMRSYRCPVSIALLLLVFAVPTFAQKFAPPTLYPPAGSNIQVADFNHDGKADLVTTAGVLLGRGDGTFEPAKPLPSGTIATPGFDFAVADFNGDGKPDLAIIPYPSHSVQILLGNGDGTFQPPATYTAGAYQPYGLWSADFNHDGHVDLAVALDGDHLNILFGKGNGSFDSPVAVPFPATNQEKYAGIRSLKGGDFNRDGNIDLIVTSQFGGCFSCPTFFFIFLGKGDGTFEAPVRYNVWTYGTFGTDDLTSTLVGDFNGDGNLDLAFATDGYDSNAQPNAGVAIMLGNGDGTFQPATNYTLFGPNTNGEATGGHLWSADFNNDGKVDLVSTDIVECSSCSPPINNPTEYVTVLLGNGKGTFTAQLTLSLGSLLGDTTIVARDFNNDAAPDVAVATHSVTAVLLNTAGTYISLHSSLNPSQYLENVTFTATVRASIAGQPTPTGTVTFKNGTSVLGTVTLNSGTASFTISTLPVGKHAITALYSGDSNFNPHASGKLYQTVDKAATSTILSSSANPAPHGSPVTFTATVKSSTSGTPPGSVTFRDGTTALATVTLSSGRATFTTSSLGVGSHSMTAHYNGSTDYVASTSAVLTEQIEQIN